MPNQTEVIECDICNVDANHFFIFNDDTICAECDRHYTPGEHIDFYSKTVQITNEEYILHSIKQSL